MNEVMTKAAVRGAEWQKMVAGAPYDAGDPELKAARERCRTATSCSSRSLTVSVSG